MIARTWLIKALAVSVMVAGLAGCSEPPPAEEQIRQLNSAAETAAEAKDVSALKDMVAEDYRDPNGNDRTAVVRMVQFYMLRNKSIHLYTLTRSLEVLDDDNAVAEIFVAMAGEPIESADQLLRMRADLIRFDVRYARRDDEWKVIDVDWRRADVDDFLL